jgi:hypothetical protein
LVHDDLDAYKKFASRIGAVVASAFAILWLTTSYKRLGRDWVPFVGGEVVVRVKGPWKYLYRANFPGLGSSTWKVCDRTPGTRTWEP